MSATTKCRSCNSNNLISVISLGAQYPSNFVNEDYILDEKNNIPLELVLCGKKDCGLLQLKHTASRVSLYKEYWFRSGLNETMRKAIKDITEGVEKRIVFSPNNF